MRKKQKRRERARIATFTIMLVSILLAAGSLAVSEMKKSGKYGKNSNAKKEISKTGYAPASGFSAAAASAKAVR